ncbi:putative cucumisin [Dioscorea sansibarensis]
MIYMYDKVISGFAARLTKNEVDEMSKKDGFVAAYPRQLYSLQTTHTPQFLGLNIQNGVWNKSNYGEGMIVGVIDSGVVPDHPSFSGEGMPKPPAKWKGRCDVNATMCNNKLIGLRTFINGVTNTSPVDDAGHGTHTSSTAAGASVAGADVLGNAEGVASGMAPKAHLAMYKACDGSGCWNSDILAGMDAAIADGVDVISISIGAGSSPFYQDMIAIGAFSAVEHGIFVSCAASNGGPDASSLSNEAPWILTVAASTTDRSIRATVKLGNGLSYEGESLNQSKSSTPAFYPLVYAGDGNSPDAAFCGNGSFDGFDVKGKIVLCEGGGGGQVQKGMNVLSAGGIGMIIMNQETDGYITFADPHVLPASEVSYADGLKIKAYINSTTNATANLLFQGTVYGTSASLAPAIAPFSSRGPSIASPGILKPDIAGPGVSVLAAWPSTVSIIINSFSPKFIFNMVSGTSMATPHLSGIAALIKAAHPDWSPAAIKSAMMTTADILNKNGSLIVDERLLPANLFTVGAGHVNPVNAIDPGLVYDLKADDYIPYLCGLGYNSSLVGTILRRHIDCNTKIAEAELNYPSLSFAFVDNKTSTITVERTVKNVGEANSNYSAKIDAPAGVSVTVQPNVLQFTMANQELKFNVTVNKSSGAGGDSYSQGYLTWISDKHTVRSPISVTF